MCCEELWVFEWTGDVQGFTYSDFPPKIPELFVRAVHIWQPTQANNKGGPRATVTAVHNPPLSPFVRTQENRTKESATLSTLLPV